MENNLGRVYISTKEFSPWVKDRAFKDKDLVSIDELATKYEDALDHIEYLEEKIKDLEAENREMNDKLCYRGTTY